MNLLINANIIFSLLVFLSFISSFLLFPKKYDHDIRKITFNIISVLIFLLFLCYLTNIIVPIDKFASFTIIIVLIVAIFFLGRERIKKIHKSKILTRKNIMLFLLIVAFYNCIIIFINFYYLKNKLTIYLGTNNDVFTQEVLIRQKSTHKLLDYTCEEVKNALIKDRCILTQLQYPQMSHTFLAFLDAISPFKILIKSNYASILFAITSASIFGLLLFRPLFALLAFPLFFHPSLHAAISWDAIPQITSFIFYVFFIDLMINVSIKSIIKLILTSLGLLLTYQFGILNLIPFYIFIVYNVIKKVNLLKIIKKNKFYLIFICGLLFLGLTIFFLQFKTVKFIVNEGNSGGLLINRIEEVTFQKFFGIDYIRDAFFSAYKNPILYKIIIILYLIIVLYFFIREAGRNKILLYSQLTFLILILSANLYTYWLYKISGFWILSILISFAYFSYIHHKTKKVFSRILIFILFIFCLSVTLIWVKGVTLNYYLDRANRSIYTNQKLPEVDFIRRNIQPDNKSFVHIDLNFNYFLALQLYDIAYFSAADYPFVKMKEIYRGYQYLQDPLNMFISNFNLHKFHQLIVAKDNFTIDFIPSIFAKDMKFKNIIVYKKVIPNFDQLLFPSVDIPFNIQNNQELTKYLKNKVALERYFSNKENLLIKSLGYKTNNICDFEGDGVDFLHSKIVSEQLLIINAYKVYDIKLKPAINCRKL